jgi:hypothetical protein
MIADEGARWVCALGAVGLLEIWLVSLWISTGKQAREIKRLCEWITRLEGINYFDE